MPLPKPPAKRATLLTATDFESQVVPKPTKRPSQKSAPAAREPLVETIAPPAPAQTVVARQPDAPRPPVAPVTPPAAPSTFVRPVPAPRARKARGTGPAKLFVLDTNVLMHDPMCIFRFEEHDVYLPMITLEELDDHKKGMSEVARNARQVSRDLDALAASLSDQPAADMADGLPLAHTGHRDAGGKLFFQTTLLNVSLPAGLPQGKADNQILGVVQALRDAQPKREVVLVSKDINMRIKARALGLAAEDYFNDKTLDDGDLLYTGVQPLPADFWEQHGKTMESWSQGGYTYYRISGPLVPSLLINQFLFLEAPGATPLHAKVTEITGKTAVLRTLREYTHQKNAVWGVTARNREQNFGLNLLMDPECDFITLTGTAGTGKTLMTLAAALSQVMDDRRYTEIIVTRVTVPVGEDIVPARHRRGEDVALDGRARRQPGGAVQDRQCRRRVGPGRDQRPGAQQDQDQEPQLHARPHLPEQVRHHRRGPEPHAQADEDPHHPRGPGHEDRLPGQPGADRHPLPHRGQLRPHLRGRPLQGMAAQWPRHPGPRRALAPGGLRLRSAVTPSRAATAAREFQPKASISAAKCPFINDFLH